MGKMPKLDVPMERNLFFASDVYEDTVSCLIEDIITINEHDRMLELLYEAYNIKYEPDPIVIYIDSAGGTVYTVLGLVGVIETSVTPVHTVVTGSAMSSAFIILISGHKRFGYRYSTMMNHQMELEFNGKQKDLDEDNKEFKRLRDLFDDIIVKKTKMTKRQLKDNYDKKQNQYITADQALRWGIIDEIIGK